MVSQHWLCMAFLPLFTFLSSSKHLFSPQLEFIFYDFCHFSADNVGITWSLLFNLFKDDVMLYFFTPLCIFTFWMLTFPLFSFGLRKFLLSAAGKKVEKTPETKYLFISPQMVPDFYRAVSMIHNMLGLFKTPKIRKIEQSWWSIC